MRCAFINSGIVVNVVEMETNDEQLAQQIANEHGYEKFVFTEEASTGFAFDGKEFTSPEPNLKPIDETALQIQAQRDAVLAALAAAAGLELNEVKAVLR